MERKKERGLEEREKELREIEKVVLSEGGKGLGRGELQGVGVGGLFLPRQQVGGGRSLPACR